MMLPLSHTIQTPNAEPWVNPPEEAATPEAAYQPSEPVAGFDLAEFIALLGDVWTDLESEHAELYWRRFLLKL